jgi:hypothetical protein
MKWPAVAISIASSGFVIALTPGRDRRAHPC